MMVQDLLPILDMMSNLTSVKIQLKKVMTTFPKDPLEQATIVVLIQYAAKPWLDSFRQQAEMEVLWPNIEDSVSLEHNKAMQSLCQALKLKKVK